jgi:hypothetical protein
VAENRIRVIQLIRGLPDYLFALDFSALLSFRSNRMQSRKFEQELTGPAYSRSQVDAQTD